MEFKEFTNPEGKDYDINSSFNSSVQINTYSEQLDDLIGILEDITEETINKVSEKVSGRHR